MNTLFEKGEPVPSRKKPRRKFLMHVVDAGPAGTGDQCMTVMQCGRCDLKTEWFMCQTVTEAKRGISCPKCNGKEFEANQYGEFVVGLIPITPAV